MTELSALYYNVIILTCLLVSFRFSLNLWYYHVGLSNHVPCEFLIDRIKRKAHINYYHSSYFNIELTDLQSINNSRSILIVFSFWLKYSVFIYLLRTTVLRLSFIINHHIPLILVDMFKIFPIDLCEHFPRLQIIKDFADLNWFFYQINYF